jgi:hypothetical protein
MLSHGFKSGQCGKKLGQASNHSLAASTVELQRAVMAALLFNNCQDISLLLLHQP